MGTSTITKAVYATLMASGMCGTCAERSDAISNRGVLREASQQLIELFHLHRFHQVVVESGCLAKLLIFGPAVACESGEHGASEVFVLAHAACHLVAVHSVQTDVEQHQVGAERFGMFER